MINEGENLKLEIARKQFNIFVGDDTDTHCFLECPCRDLFKSAVATMPRGIRTEFEESWEGTFLTDKVREIVDEVNDEEDDSDDDETTEPDDNNEEIKDDDDDD